MGRDQAGDADLWERARTGDADAFADLVAPHRRELHVHCYRMLGTVHDAEDALQETLVAAWRGLPGLAGRASLRTWLYRIATNRCLDALRAGSRAPVTTPLPFEPPSPSRLGEVPWLEPYPDNRLDLADPAPGPEVVVELHESISLAYVTALQLLPPRQRAVLVLRDVLGYRAKEAAQLLDTSEESVTSALKRARAAVGPGRPRPDSSTPEEQATADRFLAAFRVHDIDAMVAVLTQDARIAMPPLTFEYHGHAAARRFFTAISPQTPRRIRTVVTRANGAPAYAVYVLDTVSGLWRAMGLLVVTVVGDKVSDVTRFEPGTLAAFGLPRSIAGEGAT